MKAITLMDINEAIRALEEIVAHYERMRDACPYESLSYWGYHDKATTINAAIIAMMP